MTYKNLKSMGRKIATLLVVSAFAMTASAATVGNDSIASDAEKVYEQVDKPAEFPGGINGLMKYLQRTIKYPEKAQQANVQGRAVVKFVIGKDGKVTDASIFQSTSSKELDEEALRVVNAMPNWQPGEINGEPVKSYFTLPVTFRLNVVAPAKK